MAAIIPLTNAPNQSMRVSLVVNGQSLVLNLLIYWNAEGGFWVMDIADQTGSPLVSSVPLLTGVWPAGNILAAYEYLAIGSAFVINQNGSKSDWPDATNLGSDFLLLWDDNPVPAAA